MIMDLNELPLESDYDFLDVESANPSYCTQLILETDGLGRKDQAQGEIFVSTVDFIDNQVAVLDGSSTHSNAIDNQVVVLDGGSTQSHAIGVLCPGVVALDARDIAVDGDIVEEVWSTPPIPYTGQTFSSKGEAREYYNCYAKRIGFSIRTSTTRLSTMTREQRKVTYVCNKEGHGKKKQGRCKYM
jgi:hypothetical protein